MKFKKTNRFADRGKETENAVQDYLGWWQERSVYREFNRLPDTKAAGRIIKAAPADFDYYMGSLAGNPPAFGLIEAKETEHEYRLSRDKISQLPRLRKREKCGGVCPILVYHSTIEKWRVIPRASMLMEFGDKGSWDLRGFPTFDGADEALNDAHPYVFEVKP
jgi:hypothetical protein